MYRAAAIAAVLAAAFLAGWATNGWRLGRDHAAERAEAERAHAVALDAARQEDNRRVAAMTENLNAAHDQLTRALADRDRARAAAGGVQQRAQALAASCAPRDPAAAGAGPAAPGPGDLLADMLRRIDDAAGELAAYADRALVAGRACERAYDALRKP